MYADEELKLNVFVHVPLYSGYKHTYSYITFQ